MTIEAVLFDFGNVLARFDYHRALDRLGAPRGASAPELLRRLDQGGFATVHADYECGRIDSRTLAAQFNAILGWSVPFEEFATAYQEIFELNPPVAQLARDLKAAGYLLGLGSNTGELHSSWFLKAYADLFTQFDHLILSHRIGVKKPHPAFYNHALRAMKVAPSACLFVDDLAENVQAARKQGLVAVHYEFNTTNLVEALAHLGVRVNR